MCCSEEGGFKKIHKNGPLFLSYITLGVCPCPKALTLNKVILQLTKTQRHKTVKWPTKTSTLDDVLDTDMQLRFPLKKGLTTQPPGLCWADSLQLLVPVAFKQRSCSFQEAPRPQLSTAGPFPPREYASHRPSLLQLSSPGRQRLLGMHAVWWLPMPRLLPFLPLSQWSLLNRYLLF